MAKRPSRMTCYAERVYMAAMVEVHEVCCTCSYCHWQMHYGLNIPKRWKEWNSWFVIKFGPRHYVRWTNSWLRIFQQRGPQTVEVTVLRKVVADATADLPHNVAIKRLP